MEAQSTNQTPADNATAKSEKTKSVVVLKPFRDKRDWNKVHHPGDDISHFEKTRIDHLIKIGYAK